MSERPRAGFMEVLGGLVFVLLIVATLPGLLVAFAVDRLLDLGLDRGQVWTFGTFASAAICGSFAAARGAFWRGLGSHLLWCCLPLAALLGLAAFGFHSEWVRAFWSAVWGL